MSPAPRAARLHPRARRWVPDPRPSPAPFTLDSLGGPPSALSRRLRAAGGAPGEAEPQGGDPREDIDEYDDLEEGPRLEGAGEAEPEHGGGDDDGAHGQQGAPAPTGAAEEAEDWIDELLDEAEDALDNDDPLSALRACEHVEALHGPHAGARFVRAEARRMLGDMRGAAAAYREAALLRPEHALSWASYAVASFELLDMEEAQRAQERALREDPSEALGWWALGLLHQWEGEEDGAERAFLHAAWLDPEGCPMPPTLEDHELDAAIEGVLQEMSPSIRAYLKNVAIVVEDMPDEEALTEVDPPLSPLEMLGSFSGHSLRERSHDEPWSNLPPTITVYRRNLERSAADRDELIEQLRVTLLHEIGHFLGLDEDDLADRGLD